MFKALTPIIGILVAVGLFFTYVQPTFEEVKMIEGETAQYDEAITRAAELNRRIEELKQQRSSIRTTDLERLEAFIPDKINEVSILIDVNELADTHNLTLGDIEVGEETSSESGEEGADEQGALPAGDPAVDPAFDPAFDPALDPGMGAGTTNLRAHYRTLDIGFSVTGTYDDFRAFLDDLEKSLVLMEVMEITFAESEGDLISYSMTIRLFSLNAPTS